MSRGDETMGASHGDNMALHQSVEGAWGERPSCPLLVGRWVVTGPEVHRSGGNSGGTRGGRLGVGAEGAGETPTHAIRHDADSI